MRQKEITELQKQIGNYGKNIKVYERHKSSGWSKDFYEAHRAGITLHQAAKKYFNGIGLKKLPSINQLKQEWAILDLERRKLFSSHKTAKQKFTMLGTAKSNADYMFGRQDRNIPACRKRKWGIY
ncbi:hypothetical protein LJC58_10265 [Lachnospiraceae bacterium OttesenSCG-928-D06]|nr:hypothetical protein [Lachnospiraceae bacterium OttesenSCG-928-D06]